MALNTEVFAQAEPGEIASFLSTLGWSRAGQQPDWTHNASELWVSHDQTAEVLVPMRRSYADYGRLVAEVCLTVGRKDEPDIDPYEVLKRIRSIPFDMVRFRAQPGSPEDSIALDEAMTLITTARTTLSVVAASAVEPRAVHPRRRPALAEAYVNRLQMAQTERGSFVVAIRSPVGRIAPVSRQLRTTDVVPQPDLPERRAAPVAVTEADDGSFIGRSVPLMLLHAVDSLESAVTAYRRSGDLAVFEETVYEGVSANLCKALSTLADLGDTSLRLSVAWSPTVPLDQPGDGDVLPLDEERFVASDLRMPLNEAAEYLTSLEAFQPIPLEGPVTGLRRSPGEMFGEAVVRSLVAGRQRAVRVLLPVAEYTLATKAHEQQRTIAFVGIPRQSGRYLVVDSPSHVHLP